jgi:hypothetical protein
MAQNTFDQIAKEQFAFLLSDYAFELAKCKEENWGYSLVYLNRSTGVEIVYEYREAYVFITLYRLVGRRLVRNPLNIADDAEIHGFALDDIIGLRNPSARMKPAYEYGEGSEYYDRETGMTLYVSRFAENLRKHAHDVLSGDFRVFSQLDRIVRERVHCQRRQKSGESGAQPPS